MVKHNKLKRTFNIFTRGVHQSEQSLNRPPIRILFDLLKPPLNTIRRIVCLRRLVQNQKSRYRSLSSSEPPVQREMSEYVIANPILTTVKS